MTTEVLVTGKMPQEALQLLESDAHLKIKYAPGLKNSELRKAITTADGMIIRTETTITDELLSHAAKLKVICRAGIGIDHIDLKACAKRKITVMNTPAANRISTAEHAIALIFSLARQIPRHTQLMKQGRWTQEAASGEVHPGMELHQKTLAIVGLGNIGRQVALRVRALGMNVIAHDPYLNPKLAEGVGVELKSLKEALNKAHFVSLHVPLTDETREMADKNFFASMKTGAYLINTSRGKVVVEKALVQALQDGVIGGAALDVFESEPLPKGSPLLQLDTVILTPHIAGKTSESQRAMGMDSAKQIQKFFSEGIVLNALT